MFTLPLLVNNSPNFKKFFLILGITSACLISILLLVYFTIEEIHIGIAFFVGIFFTLINGISFLYHFDILKEGYPVGTVYFHKTYLQIETSQHLSFKIELDEISSIEIKHNYYKGKRLGGDGSYNGRLKLKFKMKKGNEYNLLSVIENQLVLLNFKDAVHEFYRRKLVIYEYCPQGFKQTKGFE